VGNKCPHKNRLTPMPSVSVLRLCSRGRLGRARGGYVPGSRSVIRFTKSVSKPARMRSPADRFGDRWREQFTIRSWCFRRSDSATRKRTPPTMPRNPQPTKQASQDSDEMDEKHSQTAHRRIVVRREILRNHAFLLFPAIHACKVCRETPARFALSARTASLSDSISLTGFVSPQSAVFGHRGSLDARKGMVWQQA
jgi:hypothetical protein